MERDRTNRIRMIALRYDALMFVVDEETRSFDKQAGVALSRSA